MFQRFEPSPFLGYRDATFVRSTWDLQLVDCWRGLLKGIKTGLIDLKTFNPDEYDYYDHPQVYTRKKNGGGEGSAVACLGCGLVVHRR